MSRLQICVVLLATVCSVLSVSANPMQLKARATACNGDAALCSRKYSNVTYIGTHDSYSIGPTTQQSANQDVPVQTQLDDGIRALQIQGHKSDSSDGGSGISLCHSSCFLQNGGSLESYLGNVSSWLKSNPNEVVTVIMANPDNLPVSQWAKAVQSAGLDKMAYTSTSGQVSKDDWPTLRQMISKNQRVVFLMDYKADTSSTNYILPEFKSNFENPFDQTKMPFNCSQDRWDGNTNQMMYLHNHFLDQDKNLLGQNFQVPNVAKLNDTNSLETVMSAAGKCAQQHHSYPTFILVDFYETANGGALHAAAMMNGIKYNAKSLGQTNSSNSQNTSGAASTMQVTSAALYSVLIIAGLLCMSV